MEKSFSCRLTVGNQSEMVKCVIGKESIEFTSAKIRRSLNYAELQDFRLINYHLKLITALEEYELSELGHNTEEFFENLWIAYMKRSQEALFMEGTPLYSGEGDYDFTEQGISQHGIAKVELFSDALCLCPHDNLARRIPLCFSQDPIDEGFGIRLPLDTGDSYHICRIGRDTQTVFEKMCTLRKSVLKQWENAHVGLNKHIEERLGDKWHNYKHIQGCGCRMIAGLYRLDGDGIWFAGLKEGKAAVELVTQEQTATYFYRYDTDDNAFEYSIRHAMESVGLHREVIFANLSDKPLYRMTVERNYHLRFLREHNQARVIHNMSWDRNISEMLER
jgi:hypothetical protein